MSLLNPWYLLGLLAVGVPVLIHILQRDRIKRIVFPATRFLMGASKKITRTQRLRELILMLVRAAAVALLAFALCRPFFTGLLGGGGSGNSPLAGSAVSVLVIDKSGSMRIGERLAQAKKQALAKLDDLRPGLDRVAVIAFDEAAEVLVEPTDEFTAVRKAIEDLEPGYGGTALVGALQRADRMLAADEYEHCARRIDLFSDLPQHGWEDYDGEWHVTAGTDLGVHPVAPQPPANIGVAQVAMPRSTVAAPRAEGVNVKIANYGMDEKKDIKVRLEVAGKTIEEKAVNLRPEKSEIVRFKYAFSQPGDVYGRIVVEAGDVFPADDVHYFSVEVLPRIRVLLINGGPSSKKTDDDGFFLKAALTVPDSPFEVREVYATKAAPSDIDQVDAVLLANVGALSDAVLGKLEAYLEAGGGLLLFAGDKTDPAAFNDRVGRIAPCRMKEVVRAPEQSEGFRIAQVDFTHPVFQPFTAPNSGEFSQAETKGYYMVSDSQASRVLARYLDGRPAMLERRFGKESERQGISLLFTSTADLAWGDICTRGGLFVPFLHEAVRYLAVRGEGVGTAQVGQATVLQLGEGGGEITDPEGTSKKLAAGSVSYTPRQPGLYVLQEGEREHRVAVNVVAEESLAASLDPEEVTSAVSSSPAGEQVQTAGGTVLVAASSAMRERVEKSQGFGWYMLVLLAVLLVGEQILANNTSRR